VIPIAEYHLSRISRKLGKRVNRIHPDAKDPLAAYPWPGNIREVINAIEQAVNMTKSDVILLKHLPESLQNQEIKSIPTENQELYELSALEKRAIERALNHHNGNITKASKALGIGRNTLYEKMKKYGIK
jgi:transcriptional regulator with PAS, ATPase and Fis domain